MTYKETSTKFRDNLSAIIQIIFGKRTRDEQYLSGERRNDLCEYLHMLHQPRILDLANGRLRPQYLIFQSQGHRVHGIDLINRSPKDFKDWGYRYARWLFKLHLKCSVINGKDNNLVCGDVSYLPYKSNCFDLISSIASFEHFLDVQSVVAELFRILRPGGVAYIRIHPFTCPSGGHNVKLMEIPVQSLPKGVDPWDHLRNRKLPFRVPLNEWRIYQYLEEFSKRLVILKSYCAMKEGEHLLTQEIEDELSEYSRDELTCGAYVIVARKPL